MKTEIIAERTQNAKVFNLGGRKRRIETRLGNSIHVPTDFAAWRRGDPVTWEDIDTGYDNVSGEYVLRNHWFRLKVSQNKVAFRWQSRVDGQTIDMELTRLNNQPVPNNIDPPTLVDGNWQWTDIVNGFDIYLVAGSSGVHIWKRLKNAQAPKKYTWKVTESDPGSTPISYISTGYDNADNSDLSRVGAGPGRVRRRVKMLDPVLTDLGGGVTGVVEEWSGLVLNRTPNRVFVETSDVSYPVLIDPSIPQEGILDADDGYSFGGNWVTEYGTSNLGMIYSGTGGECQPGFRFLTIPTIVSGDTIDAATLTLVYGTSGGSGSEESCTIAGIDADTAPAWSNTFNPGEGVTPTTATVAFPAWGGSESGTKAITVTTIVQEIVDRAGWAADNNISFQCTFTTVSAGNYSYLGDAAGAGTPATLDIDYTAAAVPITIAVPTGPEW